MFTPESETESSFLNKENTRDVDFLFNFAKDNRFGDIHFKIDEKTGLFAIVAINSTKLGPSLGGCRLMAYDSVGDAIVDALRLARGMSYKAAVTGIAQGGGKAVLIKPKNIHDRTQYFEKFGEFVEELGGRYITAKDIGTDVSDMDTIATKTRYVACTTPVDGSSGDPSLYTARGVYRSMQAATKYLNDHESLSGKHIVMQGAGQVSYHLAKFLSKENAKITVCDINTENVHRLANDFGAEVVSCDDIYSIPCDIFSPSAIGATINDHTIPLLKTNIIAGCANNQLERCELGQTLKQRNILYAPDYLINSGGLIQATSCYNNYSDAGVEDKIDNIYNILQRIFKRSDDENLATNIITAKIAEEILYEE